MTCKDIYIYPGVCHVAVRTCRLSFDTQLICSTAGATDIPVLGRKTNIGVPKSWGIEGRVSEFTLLRPYSVHSHSLIHRLLYAVQRTAVYLHVGTVQLSWETILPSLADNSPVWMVFAHKASLSTSSSLPSLGEKTTLSTR